MINVFKKDNQLIGVYKIFLSNEELLSIKDTKSHVNDLLLVELQKDDSSYLFTYNILTINAFNDLFGVIVEILFQFIPNQEIMKEIKIVAERLQVGL
jgi:hypothetical protein